MQVYLDKYLHENFGDLYTTKIKNCGAVLSNEVEYEPSVYIEATDSAKYRGFRLLLLVNSLP